MPFFSDLYSNFDSAQAGKLAELIQHAYTQYDRFDKNKDIVKPLVKLGQDFQLKSELYENKIPFGFVASEPNSNDVFVVFRGTRRFIEWFKDVNIPLVSYSAGKVEQGYGLAVVEGFIQLIDQPEKILELDDFGLVALGFRQIYINLRKQMIAALEQCCEDSPNSRIFVTGHSLGGALATLAIPDIIKNIKFTKYKEIKLYTFASPRCGNRKFADAFKETKVEHWRIANTEDMVTMLPFPTGNVFRPDQSPETPPNEDRKINYDNSIEDLGNGGVAGVDKNPNPLFGFFKAMYERSGDLLLKKGNEVYNRQKRRMPEYVHTGTPIYFTFHEAALERHHNLDEVYMTGIGQKPLNPPISP